MSAQTCSSKLFLAIIATSAVLVVEAAPLQIEGLAVSSDPAKKEEDSKKKYIYIGIGICKISQTRAYVRVRDDD